MLIQRYWRKCKGQTPELLPFDSFQKQEAFRIKQFDISQDMPREIALELINYWNYSTWSDIRYWID